MAILTMKPNKSNDMELKSRMTVEEMAAHLREHTGKFANRVSVGLLCQETGLLRV